MSFFLNDFFIVLLVDIVYLKMVVFYMYECSFFMNEMKLKILKVVLKNNFNNF